MAKDLGIKMGTKEEKAWTDIMERATEEIGQYERTIILNKVVIEECQKRILEEKEKLK